MGIESIASTTSPTLIDPLCAGLPSLTSVTTNAPCDDPVFNLISILINLSILIINYILPLTVIPNPPALRLAFISFTLNNPRAVSSDTISNSTSNSTQ